MNESITAKYAKRREAMEKRYRTLQRRTLLYGALATSVAGLIAVAIGIRLPAPESIIVGAVLSFLIVQGTIVIVRRLNPLVEEE